MSYTVHEEAACQPYNIFDDDRSFATWDEACDAQVDAWDLDHTQIWPLAIDPIDCHCTECCAGQYVPLDMASPQHVADMLDGRLLNNTGDTPQVKTVVALGERTFEIEQ
jgi:hypothetical protein